MAAEVMTAAGLVERLRARFPEGVVSVAEPRGEVTLDLEPGQWLATATAMRDELGFEQLIDITGVDYMGYGFDEWSTLDATGEGFSRGVEGKGPGRFVWGEAPTGAADAPDRRFAVVMHLLSYRHNLRVRLRAFPANDELPLVDSVTSIWPVADWFERETFDLYGIIFQGHPDLRRILTDYGFVGHPFRKDFPLIGNVEVRYDAEKRRVIYEPVSIDPRVTVPRVIRDDARYETAADESANRSEGRQ